MLNFSGTLFDLTVMKKLFSILFAAMILLSGMHLTLATHLCGGEVSAVKLTFIHEKANCGMCSGNDKATTDITVSNKSCCKDEMSFYVVDCNYNSSTSLHINKPVNDFVQVYCVLKYFGFQFLNSQHFANTYAQPPGEFLASAVNLPGICVFLI